METLKASMDALQARNDLLTSDPARIWKGTSIPCAKDPVTTL